MLFRSVPYRAPQNLIGLTQDPYLAGLDKLKADFKSHDVCAEVYLAKARYAVEKQQQVMALQIWQSMILIKTAGLTEVMKYMISFVYGQWAKMEITN